MRNFKNDSSILNIDQILKFYLKISILTVKFGLNCMIFHETTLYISVNFSQCLVLPEPIFFPIKGDTYTLQKNDIRPFALFCIFL